MEPPPPIRPKDSPRGAMRADLAIHRRVLTGLLVGLVAMNALLGAYFLFAGPFAPVASSVTASGLVAALFGLLWLRRGGGLAVPVGVVNVQILGSLIFGALFHGATHILWTPWWAIPPLLGAILVGVRAGAVTAGLVTALVLLGGVLGRGADLTVPAPHLPVHTAVSLLALLAIWVFVAVYHRSHTHMAAATERAFEEAEHDRERLASLVNHTSVQMCSLDRDLILLELNDPLQTSLRQIHGRDIPPGTPFLSLFSRPERVEVWRARIARALEGEVVRVTDHPPEELQGIAASLDITITPIRPKEGEEIVGVTIYGSDITDRVQADARLREANRQMLAMSRQAGMAEIATGMLHDIGNVLTSINVTTTAVEERASKLGVERLAALAEALTEGRELEPGQVAAYLRALTEHLHAERERILDSTRSLARDVGVVRTIVAAQQEQARAKGITEVLHPEELMDQALEMHQVAFSLHGVELVRDYERLPPIEVDRHKVLQILLNLLSNARHAVRGWLDAQVVVSLRLEEGEVLFVVDDNGVGIEEGDLDRIFEHGWTTRSDGNGFGLHASANAAAELGGTLVAASAGPERGATFTLRLPAARDPVPDAVG